MADLGENLQYGTVTERFGTVYLCGWYDNAIWVAASSSTNLVREELAPSTELAQVCTVVVAEGGAIPYSAITVTDDCLIVEVTSAGTTRTFRCRDISATTPFEEVTGV